MYCSTNSESDIAICDPLWEKGPLGINFHFPIIAKMWKKWRSLNFLFLSSLENVDFLLHIDILCLYSWNMWTVVTGTNSYSDTYKLIQNLIKKCEFSEKQTYLPECIKTVITPLVINIFVWNLHHCIQHTQGYPFMPKTQFFWKIANGPFTGVHRQVNPPPMLSLREEYTCGKGSLHYSVPVDLMLIL